MLKPIKILAVAVPTMLLAACSPEKPQTASLPVKTIPLTYNVQFGSDAQIPVSHRGEFMRSLKADLATPKFGRKYELTQDEYSDAHLSVTFYRALKVHHKTDSKIRADRKLDFNCNAEIQLHARVMVLNDAKIKADTMAVTNIPVEYDKCQLEGYSHIELETVTEAMKTQAGKVAKLVREKGRFY